MKKITVSLLISFIPLFFSHCMEERENPLSNLVQQLTLDEAENQEQKNFVIKFGQHLEQGFRVEMEDLTAIEVPFFENKPTSGVFAIFDGHGTYDVAKFAANHLIEELKMIEGKPEKMLIQGLLNLNNKLEKERYKDIGSCAIVGLLDGNNLTVANLGDSKLIVSRNGKAIALSDDHNCLNQHEQERIKKITGRVPESKRLNGYLSVSRALGDFDFIQYGLTAEPEIRTFIINQETDFFILASDGIWDVIDPQTAIDIVKESLEEHKEEGDAETLAARELVEIAWTGFKDKKLRQKVFDMLNNITDNDTQPWLRAQAAKEISEAIINSEDMEFYQTNIQSTDNLSVIVVRFEAKEN